MNEEVEMEEDEVERSGGRNVEEGRRRRREMGGKKYLYLEGGSQCELNQLNPIQSVKTATQFQHGHPMVQWKREKTLVYMEL